MSKGSSHELSVIRETVAGTTPATPRFSQLPDARTTLGLTKGQLATERLTSGRFPAKPRTGAKSVVGEIPVDLPDSAFDEMIASALQGTWSAKTTPDSFSATIDGAATAGIVEGDTHDTANGQVTFERVAGAAQQVQAKYVEAGVTTNHFFEGFQTITIDGEDFEITAYSAVGEESVLKAGDTRSSFSVCRHFSDLAGGEPYMLFAGCEVGSFGLSASANALAKATFTFLGQSGGLPLDAASLPAGTNFSEPIETLPFDTFSGNVKIDGVSTDEVTEYSLSVDNGLAEKFGIDPNKIKMNT